MEILSEEQVDQIEQQLRTNPIPAAISAVDSLIATTRFLRERIRLLEEAFLRNKWDRTP